MENNTSKSILGGLVALLINTPILLLSFILPVYAAIKDIQADKIFWGIIDIITVIPGVIRGIMYFFGYL